ncbi:hypothetical protein RMAECT_1235 [Rickettsia rhipicephali str. Ect]|uniref:Uncharacterized protein n=1 Tax=Rickettsia rhipicephali str. Ect TaxID=1359199 RepID=A0A0F3PHY4_RICRH|nr:hypothetical protein RMAECT_1235 [Rickettsia rhipicephali str. Ect]
MQGNYGVIDEAISGYLMRLPCSPACNDDAVYKLKKYEPNRTKMAAHLARRKSF